MNFRFPLAVALLALCSVALADDRVGLSLLFQNGSAAPIKLVGNHSRYLQEVDIAVTSPPTSADLGIQPIRTSGEFAGLNWTGVQMVEEDWRPDGAGKFTRQRFYRGAQWMKSLSLFTAIPMNANNVPVGLPLIAFAVDSVRRLRREPKHRRRWVRAAFQRPPNRHRLPGDQRLHRRHVHLPGSRAMAA
jgi:hypothetical protein